MRRSSRRWPTRRPKAAASSCWPSRSSTCASATCPAHKTTFVPFTAQTRMSGVDISRRRQRAQLRKGAGDAIRKHVEALGGSFPADVQAAADERGAPGQHAAGGGRRVRSVLGVVELKDIVKGGIKERFAELRRMGIKTVMITGDNRAHRRRHRRRGRRRRLPGRGHARGQAEADPRLPGRRPAGGDDRRRHQRRAGAGAGRRGGGDEHRHAGRQGGRQHGRPGLQPDQAARDRRDRQAAADDARLAHHLLASPTTWPSTSPSSRRSSSPPIRSWRR